MPTYLCSGPTAALNGETKAKIASTIGRIHVEKAGGARYFAQVIFVDVPAGNHFIAGQPAHEMQYWIRGDIRSGRTAAQKTAIVLEISRQVGALMAILPEQVWVYLNDVPAEGISEYGHVLPTPGEEAAWIAALPAPLQDRLRQLS